MEWPESADAAPLGDGRRASAVDRPESVAQLRELVPHRASQGYAIYPQGGKTALDYGGIPRRPGIAVDLTTLNRVVDYPAADMTITLEAGMTLAALQAVLAGENQRLPLDAPQPDRATLGGIFATNTCGPRRFGAGRPRDMILGVEFVSSQGQTLKGGGRVVKNVAGYDFPKLLTGSLGTLGIISQITLKVRPKPEAAAVVLIPINGHDLLLSTVSDLNTSGTRPMYIEVANGQAFSLMAGGRDHSVLEDAEWVLALGFEDNAASVAWQVERALQETRRSRAEVVIVEGAKTGGLAQDLTDFASSIWGKGVLSLSVSLPRSQAIPFATRLDPSNWAVKVHAGSGVVNAHASDDFPHEVLIAQVAKLQAEVAGAGGSLVLTKCPSEWKGQLSVWGLPRGDWLIMERIKRALDPGEVMNPGRFVATI